MVVGGRARNVHCMSHYSIMVTGNPPSKKIIDPTVLGITCREDAALRFRYIRQVSDVVI